MTWNLEIFKTSFCLPLKSVAYDGHSFYKWSSEIRHDRFTHLKVVFFLMVSKHCCWLFTWNYGIVVTLWVNIHLFSMLFYVHNNFFVSMDSFRRHFKWQTNSHTYSIKKEHTELKQQQYKQFLSGLHICRHWQLGKDRRLNKATVRCQKLQTAFQFQSH